MFKAPESDYNFIEMEKKWLKHWYENDVVKQYLHKNDSSDKRFSFLDGPITANNPMGVHHGWGRTYKDLWQKFYNLLGHKQRFQNGFDCQGLWVEVEVEKELGLKSKMDIEELVPGDKTASIAKFVDLCKARVLKFSAMQTEQTQRLGNFMDWEHSYFTMSDENNYMIWHFLKVCHENGWIYKGHESVPWCPRCQTAISQHEMLTEDYKELVHDSIYLELPIKGRENEYLIIWTTTPWTLPANIAVAVGAKLEYSLVQGTSGDFFWVAKDAVDRVFGKDYQKIVKTVKGKELVGLSYTSPFDELPEAKKLTKSHPDTFHVVVATDEQILPISATEGTGLVHTAVSAGVEDFRLGKKLGLPMIPVIADNADYLPSMDFLAGKNAKKHPEIIFEYLKEREETKKENWIFKIEKYKHRYPACWRCKTELVWKVADEWYIAMDSPSRMNKEDKRTLRERMMEVAKKIHWMPEFGLERELDWLKNMHDWLISKPNRYWGLALPIYECTKCHNFEIMGSKVELKERAVKGWDIFEGHTPHKPYIDEVIIKCLSCGQEVKRLNDVGNVWLDAGIVPFSTITEHNQGEPLYLKNKEEWKSWFPTDFITESFPGQFKNWFYSMIAMSTVLEDTNPFKTVLGFGTLLGEDGRPMHKSWGNSVEFNEGADKIGVDVMRWMYARQNPVDNMLFGYKRADEVRRQFYLILWNVYKYFIEYANLDKFKNPLQGKQDSGTKIQDSQNILDIWILNRFYWLVEYVEKALREFNAKDAAVETEKFVNDVSTWYIRRSRNRLGTHSEDNQDKQSFYTTLYFILKNLSVILSPFTPFLSEEIYTNLTDGTSVHLSNWPHFSQKVDDSVITEMQLVRDIVEVGQRKRKDLQIKVRQPLALLTITIKKSKNFSHSNHAKQYSQLIKDELNVKEVKLIDSDREETVVEYDTNITEELKLEGEMRDLMRTIQSMRKEKGIKINDKIKLTLPDKFKPFEDQIKKSVLASDIRYADKLQLD